MGKVAAVSSLGRFRSTEGVVSTPKPRTNGYVIITIHKKDYRLHRLSAFAFQLPRKEGQTYVNHIDGDPSNNKVFENLEWCSHAENIRHSYKTNKTRASSVPRRSKPVLARRVGKREWKSFSSQMEAARHLGVNCGNISACLQKKQTQTGGYEFAKGDPTEPPLLEGEEWRDCRQGGKVSSLGRFQSKIGVITTRKPNQDGYCRVSIASKDYSVHRLVAEAFLLPPTPKHKYVNHKDGNPSNNHVSNLEWCTHSENIAHSFATNLNRGSSAGRKAKPIRGRPVQGGEWTLYSGGANEAARALEIDQGSISQVCNGKKPTAGGYVFEFDEPTEVDVLEGEEWRDVTEEILGFAKE